MWECVPMGLCYYVKMIWEPNWINMDEKICKSRAQTTAIFIFFYLEGDVECFSEYMELWIHRMRIEGLRPWLSSILRIQGEHAEECRYDSIIANWLSLLMDDDDLTHHEQIMHFHPLLQSLLRPWRAWTTSCLHVDLVCIEILTGTSSLESCTVDALCSYR